MRRERHTLSEDIHGIVDLNVHMVADGLQLLALCRDSPPIPRLDLVRRRAVPREAASYDDALAVLLRFVGFLALVLELHGYLGDAAHDGKRMARHRSRIESLTSGPHE